MSQPDPAPVPDRPSDVGDRPGAAADGPVQRPSASAYLGLALGLLTLAVVAVVTFVLVTRPAPDLRGLPPFTPAATSTGVPTGTPPTRTGDGGAATTAPGATTGPAGTDPADPAPTTDPTTDPPADAGGVPPGVAPGDLGDDPANNALAQQCFEGSLDACDSLYFNSEIDSAYEAYGADCGGRRDIAPVEFSPCMSLSESG